MTIRTAYVSSEFPGVLRPEYTVDGDPKAFNTFTDRADAEKREAELRDQQSTDR